MYQIKNLFIILYLFWSAFVNAQGRDNLWLFGYDNSSGLPWGGSTIDFSQTPINPVYTNRVMNFNATGAWISDASGNLLFASNGDFIMNRVNDTMANGKNLNPGTFTDNYRTDGLPILQGNIIIPDPSDSNQYYLFHTTAEYLGNWIQPIKLYYSKINMLANNGDGAVIQKNSGALYDTLTMGQFTAVRHANGRDWWIVVHKFNSDLFYCLLITPNGISIQQQHIGPVYLTGSTGQSVFSRDGTKFARYEPSNFEDLDLYDFDRCTGLFSNWEHVGIQDSMNAGGVSFSPSSKLLYVTSLMYIYQFDLQSPNWNTDYDTVAVYDGYYSPFPPIATNFLASYLAPDNKIYMTSTSTVQAITVINYPDSAGLACDVCQHCISLPTLIKYTIPNFPNYFLASDTASICDSLMLGNASPLQVTRTLNLYPNPAHDILKISVEGLKGIKGNIYISNSMGEIVYFKPFRVEDNGLLREELDLRMFSTGIYLVMVKTDAETISDKFIY